MQALALKETPGWAIGAMALSLFLLYALTRARRTIDSAA